MHVPAGAIPKDGPSAGVAMLTALAEHLHAAPRAPRRGDDGRDHACAGSCCPWAASRRRCSPRTRAGITRVVLPERNERDVNEVRPEALDGLDVVYVSRMEDALKYTLEETPKRDPKQYFRVTDEDKEAARGAHDAVPKEVVMG